jgi:hypothetical protein
VHFENEINWKSLMHLGPQVLDWMDAEVCPGAIRGGYSVLPIRKYPVVPGKGIVRLVDVHQVVVEREREGEEGATNDVTRNSRHLYKAWQAW